MAYVRSAISNASAVGIARRNSASAPSSTCFHEWVPLSHGCQMSGKDKRLVEQVRYGMGTPNRIVGELIVCLVARQRLTRIVTRLIGPERQTELASRGEARALVQLVPAQTNESVDRMSAQ
jgi:hypothetical protein|eukprot:COSAG03_NODE_398_length_8226_cov_34.651655_10_plen_121_part_00